jgi:hypothetical protein
MTLLHTKGYSGVLESVKMRAQNGATDMARIGVVISPRAVLEALPNITRRELAGAVAATPADELPSEEYADIALIFAEDFIHHYRYELEQVRSERAAALRVEA